jgi:hypothetical protein
MPHWRTSFTLYYGTIACWSTSRPCSITWRAAGRDLFNIPFDVLLHNLTSTYF